MPKLSEVCHDIRSKNAGPFWITVDLFFNGREAFDRYAAISALQPPALAACSMSGPIKLAVIPCPNCRC